ncbi:hypothetical protein OEA41_002715 [Lepraria neglecta]|uniref:Uncharacterized protein n=1 Tax=Lepraria neglecta TaxID=209136 RepID=A0AAE0DIC7_9LECA|nr:hypothetical protein OEA41_002715 [Lepraria neglecta]
MLRKTNQSSDDTMSEDEDIESESCDEQAIDGDEWHMLKEIVRVKVTKKCQDYYQKIKSSLILEDNSPPKSFNSEPNTEGLRIIFRTESRRLKYEGERRLGRGVEMAAVSLPDYCEEQMARIAYNLGEKKDRESWFLILVDYHPEYLYVTFAEMTDYTDRDSHPVYPIDRRYLRKNLGETSRIRSPADDQHCRNIKDAFRVFLLKHTVRQHP